MKSIKKKTLEIWYLLQVVLIRALFILINVGAFILRILKKETAMGNGLRKANLNKQLNEITPNVKIYMLGWTCWNTFPVEEKQSKF